MPSGITNSFSRAVRTLLENASSNTIERMLKFLSLDTRQIVPHVVGTGYSLEFSPSPLLKNYLDGTGLVTKTGPPTKPGGFRWGRGPPLKYGIPTTKVSGITFDEEFTNLTYPQRPSTATIRLLDSGRDERTVLVHLPYLGKLPHMRGILDHQSEYTVELLNDEYNEGFHLSVKATRFTHAKWMDAILKVHGPDKVEEVTRAVSVCRRLVDITNRTMEYINDLWVRLSNSFCWFLRSVMS